MRALHRDTVSTLASISFATNFIAHQTFQQWQQKVHKKIQRNF